LEELATTVPPKTLEFDWFGVIKAEDLRHEISEKTNASDDIITRHQKMRPISYAFGMG
jgi:hypothetical protein